MGYTTPNIDRIAREGTAFTDYYGQQSCTAGRAAFIGGTNPLRTGMTKVGVPGAKEGWQKSDVTIATVLKAHGYATGQFGKNHQGDRDEHLPTMHGFDEFLGNLCHLNAEEEPANEDYPADPAFRKQFGPRGVLKVNRGGPPASPCAASVDQRIAPAHNARMGDMALPDSTELDAVGMRRLAVQEYRRMLEVGILPADARVELLEGRIYGMAPIGSLHAGVLTALVEIFVVQLAATKRAVVWVQNAIEILPDSAPQPDLALLKWREDRYRDALPRPADVLLVVEVADSTLARDRSKLDTYARAGIPEAWVIDAQAKCATVARDPSREGYRDLTAAPPLVSPLHFPDLAIDLSTLLP